MGPEERAAYIIAVAAAAMVEAMGMVAENQLRNLQNASPAYGEQAFRDVIQRYGIDHNAAVSFLREL